MSTTAKKQKNTEYYLKNREKILSRARERNHSRRCGHLEIVPKLRSVDAQSESSSKAGLEFARESEKIHPLSEALQEHASGNYVPGNAQAIAAVEALALFDVEYQVSRRSTDDSLVFGSKDSQMENLLKLSADMPLKSTAPDSETMSEDSLIRKKGRFFSRIPLSFILRLFLVTCLTFLMVPMQVEFYREHDILPGYAVPLTLASEVAFLSLVSMKFSRSLEWLRIIIHLTFVGYFISALSFQVYGKFRSKAASRPVAALTEMTEIGEQLKQAERSLDIATRGRAWKNMEIFGAEVSRLRKLGSDISPAQVLGTSLDQVLWMEAALLILLRALILAASALNALRLRNQLSEITIFPR